MPVSPVDHCVFTPSCAPSYGLDVAPAAVQRSTKPACAGPLENRGSDTVMPQESSQVQIKEKEK